MTLFLPAAGYGSGPALPTGPDPRWLAPVAIYLGGLGIALVLGHRPTPLRLVAGAVWAAVCAAVVWLLTQEPGGWLPVAVLSVPGVYVSWYVIDPSAPRGISERVSAVIRRWPWVALVVGLALVVLWLHWLISWP